MLSYGEDKIGAYLSSESDWDLNASWVIKRSWDEHQIMSEG